MLKIHLNPYFESKPWGGTYLNKLFKLPLDKKIGEAWTVSTILNKESKLDNGETLSNFVTNNLSLLGLKSLDEFPVLIKLIDAKKDLSIQVHPDDEYAISKGYKNGKYECWYILKETKNNKIIYNLNKVLSKEELKEIINNGKLENCFNYKTIKVGDLIKITPGTIHAILNNTFLLEVQDPCDITYRLYDYNRVPKRELHIEDSLNVIYKNKKEIDTNKFKIFDENNVISIKIFNFCRFFFEINKLNYQTYLIIS